MRELIITVLDNGHGVLKSTVQVNQADTRLIMDADVFMAELPTPAGSHLPSVALGITFKGNARRAKPAKAARAKSNGAR